MLERQLALAEQHIAQSEKHIARQKEIIAKLESGDHAIAAGKARALLDQFLELRALYIGLRDRLRAELAK